MKITFTIIAMLGLTACATTTTTDMERAKTACAGAEETEVCISETYASLRQTRTERRATLGMTTRDTGKPEGGSQTLREASQEPGR